MTATIEKMNGRTRIEAGLAEDEKRYAGFGGFLELVALADCPSSEHLPPGRRAAELIEKMHRSGRRAWGETERRALNQASGIKGGYLVPDAMLPEIMQVVDQVAIVRPRATVVGMEADEVAAPILNQQASSGVPFFGGFRLEWIAADGEAMASTDASFRGRNLSAHALGGCIDVNRSLLKNAPAMSPLLAKMFGESVAYFEDEAFLAGDGVGKPLGLTNAPGLLSSAARASGSSFVLADFAKVWTRMLPANRRRATWLLSRSVDSTLMATTAPSGSVVNPAGYYMPDLADPRSESPGDYVMFGRPALVSEHLPALNTLGDVMLADLRQYLVGDRVSIEVSASEHVSYRDNRVVFRVIHRVAGLPLASTAITPADGGLTVGAQVALGTA